MPDPREKGRESYKSRGKAAGTFWYYFILHNLISGILFFAITFGFGLFDRRAETFVDLFMSNFIELVGTIYFLSIILGISARFIAYAIMWQIIENLRGKDMRSFKDLNRGINSFGLPWFISLLIGAVAYAVGALVILQVVLFGEQTVVWLIISYLIMNAFIYLIVRLMIR